MNKFIYILLIVALAVVAQAGDTWEYRKVSVDGHVVDRMALAFYFDPGPEYNMAVSYQEPYSITFCGWPETSQDCVVLTLEDLDQMKPYLQHWQKTGRFYECKMR